MENEQPVTNNDTSNYNPLKEAVEHKPQKQVRVDQSLLTQDIPEPVINLSSVHNEEDIFASKQQNGHKQSGTGSPSNGQPKKPTTFNPALNDLPPAQKKQSAEYLSNLIMTGYQKLHDWGNHLLQIGDRKIIKWQTTGEVDLSVPVPYTTAEWMPMGEFIQEYNSQAGKTFSISPEFREDVEPALIRILEKYGHGLSDEQYLASLFIQDASFKIAKGYQMRTITRSIIEFAKDQTKNARMGAEPPAPIPPAPQPATPGQEPVGGYSSTRSDASEMPTQTIVTTMDAQSQAVADLVVGPGTGTVQQTVPVYGSKKHLKRAEKISKRNGKGNSAKTRKPRRTLPPNTELSE